MRTQIELMERRVTRHHVKMKILIKAYISKNDIAHAIKLEKILRAAKRHELKVYYNKNEKLVFVKEIKIIIPNNEQPSWNKLSKRFRNTFSQLIKEILEAGS